ncbi:MAG: hypothetical protein ACXABY_20020 [Candidatus Thorarchaeota archaeon]
MMGGIDPQGLDDGPVAEEIKAPESNDKGRYPCRLFGTGRAHFGAENGAEEIGACVYSDCPGHPNNSDTRTCDEIRYRNGGKG